MKNANGSLGNYTRAKQSDVQLGLKARRPRPKTDLGGDYVRPVQSGRQTWSPNLVGSDEPTP
ncbi:hypothetical protein CH272_08260 [Rhodococcus sp. 05-340-1]|nr:hypothetical protein CH271_17425 [Rhodococcus sp. 05-340-2]OZD80765.1 hypothetical protein CH272_08260 [Rhodococcus sp. 05-340-1]